MSRTALHEAYQASQLKVEVKVKVETLERTFALGRAANDPASSPPRGGEARANNTRTQQLLKQTRREDTAQQILTATDWESQLMTH